MQLQTFRAGSEDCKSLKLWVNVACQSSASGHSCCSLLAHISTTSSVLTCLLQTLCTAFTLPLALALAMLLVWNLWLAARNLTTIEFHEVSH